MKKLEDEIKRKLNSQQENQLSLIDKQRRTWETTREKAEQMSQIFESLIITSKISCFRIVWGFHVIISVAVKQNEQKNPARDKTMDD